ncbi:PaaI family thioesterase [Denitratisoma oestradiolicum]|uniref:Thioesterase n=1 Tax=Denitratisoma oestradiolicum TaxID=311182 RepID=A0A6S6XT91_9PROT|nr:PaaI family thioesterase [Denitratisoma oestradiolicum]TWO82256.1 hypothetical protein CBW56_02100 [Denitratisoma oestradiolicum]CAB1369208.1 conserved protein of unknown function [Denitratisoma oestradiolicum]
MSAEEDTFNPFECPTVKAPVNDDWAARREAVEAARAVIGKLVTTTSDAATLRSVAADLLRQAEILDQAPSLHGRLAFENGLHGTSRRLGYELNPLDGKSNPLAPPFNTWFEDGVAHGRAYLDWRYEGPPNTVHGGFVCAVFDQFLGIAQSLTGQPGPTGTLTTRMHRPTPLCTELHLIGRVKEVKGRKNILEGEIWANGIMTASAEGLFIHVSAERFRQLMSGPT